METTARRPPVPRWLLALAILTVLPFVAVGVAGPIVVETIEPRREDTDAEKVPAITDAQLSGPGMRTSYWQKRRPDACHYRLSRTERRWLVRTDARLGDGTCGTWPD